LFSQKRELLITILFNRKTALVWDFSKIDKIKSEVASDQEICTIEYKIWQASDFPISRALNIIVIKILKKRLRAELLKYCYKLYQNLWFLINKKEKNKYCIVNAVININNVTIQDTNISSNIEKFAEEFAEIVIALLIDFFSNYNQIDLALKSRNLTAFITPLDLLRITRLSQKTTNSIVQFVQVITHILKDLLDKCISFVDNIDVKSSKTNYNNKKAILDIRLFVLNYIQ